MNKSKYKALIVSLLLLVVSFATLASADNARQVAKTARAGNSKIDYDIGAVYNFGQALTKLAYEVICDDVSHGRYVRTIRASDQYGGTFVYEHNGIYVEFAGSLSTERIWKIKLPAFAIPEEMSNKAYYLAKLGVTGFDEQSNVLTVGIDAATITIQFDKDRVTDITLEVDEV